MDKIQWIRDLVLSEQQMEESGIVDMKAGFDPEQLLESQSLDFLTDLKAAFVESAAAFNQMKGSTLGQIKIYGISRTKADFMLFRNGYKLIFSLRQAGLIAIGLHTMSSHFIPGPVVAASAEPSSGSPAGLGAQQQQPQEETLKARWGAFGELKWTYKDHPVNISYLVRYYMTRFVRESAK